MKIFTAFYCSIFLLTTLVLSSCNLFIAFPDPCEEVHEEFPNVGEDSCRFVRDLMRNYRPPTTLPTATDTGGLFIAARIIADTGEFIFVTEGIPNSFADFTSSCSGFEFKPGEESSILGGNYCPRPPLDDRFMQIIFAIDNENKLVRIGIDMNRLSFFSIKDSNQGRKTFVVSDSTNIEFNAIRKYDERIIYGTFSGTYHNRDDTTETIQVVDGRFDSFF